MMNRWGASTLLALAMVLTAASQVLAAQEKKSRPKEGAESQQQEQQSDPDAESRKDRLRIRVLSDPMDISSFYRRGGGASYSPYRRYYGYPPAASYGAYPAPTGAPPISRYYRSQEIWVDPFFSYPGGYPAYAGAVPPGYYYGRPGLFDRARRPGFFLEALPGGFCPCLCGGK